MLQNENICDNFCEISLFKYEKAIQLRLDFEFFLFGEGVVVSIFKYLILSDKILTIPYNLTAITAGHWSSMC